MEVEGRSRRGRPRSEEARRAILNAALALAAERGADGITMEAIAARSKVSKDTLYRWWNSKTEVVLEALGSYGEETIRVPDTGCLRTDLRTFMRATSRALDAPTRRALRVVAAGAAADAGYAETVREQFLGQRRAALSGVLERAVARQELSPVPEVNTILDFVFGSLWYRLIFDVGPLDGKWADAVTAAIVDACPHQVKPVGLLDDAAVDGK